MLKRELIIKEIHDQFLPNLMGVIYQVEFWEKTGDFSTQELETLMLLKENLNETARLARQLLLKINPIRVVGRSLPKELDFYLKRLKKNKGIKYRWLTPPPKQQIYKNQDALMLCFLELLANIPATKSELEFSFEPSPKQVKLSFSLPVTDKNWFSKRVREVVVKRLSAVSGKIRFASKKGKQQISIIIPQ